MVGDIPHLNESSGSLITDVQGLTLGTEPPFHTVSIRSQVNTEGMLLCRSILVLKQLITDELNSRADEPKLLYEFVSMVLCTPNA